MKKKVCFFIICLVSCIYINAKTVKQIDKVNYYIDEVKYYCDQKEYYLSEYLSNGKIVISNNSEQKIYSNGNCYDLSDQDKLDILNNIVNVELLDENDDVVTITKYKSYYGYREGYVLNDKEYDENTIYYENADNYFKQVIEVDKEKINNYYVIKKFKNIPNSTLNENETYYVEDDNELFVVGDSDSIEYTKLYIEISDTNAYKDKKEYSYKKGDIEKIIDINDIDTDTYNIDGIVINDTLYFMVYMLDDEQNYIDIKYYDIKGEKVFDFFDNKIISSLDNYIIAEDLNHNEFLLYNKEYNLIHNFSFENKMNLITNNDYEDVYLSFINTEGLIETYFINSEIIVNFNVYFIAIGIVFAMIILYGILINKEGK